MSFCSPSPFICPICQSPLQVGEKVWHCQPDSLANNQKSHSFDVAKQGYVNLLPVQFKKSKNPGDSEAAILARQRFLQQGYYSALAQSLLDFASAQLPAATVTNFAPTPIWLDVGCGEGYYTEQFLSLNNHHLVAMDISKPAVLATAKRLRQAHFQTQTPAPTLNHASEAQKTQTAQTAVTPNSPTPFIPLTTCIVATASQIPLADKSVRVISSIFSPILPEEFARLLPSGGAVLIAKPLPNHLLQLRQGLFDSVVPHDSEKFIEKMAENFVLQAEQTVQTQIQVDATTLADLLTMTPYAYRASPTKRQALLEKTATKNLELTLEFILYWFVKK